MSDTIYRGYRYVTMYQAREREPGKHEMGHWCEISRFGRFVAVTPGMRRTRAEAEAAARAMIDRLTPLFREEHEREPWEVLIVASGQGRYLTREEVEGLDAATVKAAYAHGLLHEEAALERLTEIADEARERSDRAS